ncbi:hypothetical protein Cpir12675_002032 [Ceratocystis pirilliformis]|uniref:Uncharacterized protein n=1 Tax=Ceratocystis pirilliformis TaxID=259994 RepID=A0ABR3ZEW2_9PEZI
MAPEEEEQKEKIPFKCIELGPGGDTLIILQEIGANHVKLHFGLTSSSDNAGPPSEVHFLVSKKHLTLASRRAENMFAGDFKEAIPNDTDGLCHWKFDPIFNTKAFEIVINTIH